MTQPPLSTSAPTQTVQAHPKPISSSRSGLIIPPPPKNVESGECSIPVGSFLETKRLMGGKPLQAAPPQQPVQSSSASKDKPGASSKPSQIPKPIPKPKEKPRIAPVSIDLTENRTNPEIIVSIPLVGLPQHPPQAPVSSSAPVTSSVPLSSSAQAALHQLSFSAAHSALGKGVSARGRSKGKGPLLLKCTFQGCPYSTFNRGDFTIHMDKHAGVRFKCGTCPKDFGSKKARDSHLRTAHLGQHRAPCPEVGCNFSHNDHGVTRVHLYVEHGIGEEPKCRHPDCKGRDMFSNFRVYERHKKSFHIAKDQQCPHCVRKFKGPEKLQAHIKISHSKEVTVQCDQCGKLFASAKSLNAHKESQH